MTEAPFPYGVIWVPPTGQGYTRYASTTLYRNPWHRLTWSSPDYTTVWIMDDFGFLITQSEAEWKSK